MQREKKESFLSLSLSLSVWKLLVGGKLVLSNYVPWGRRGNRDPAEILVKINGKKIGGKNERSSSGKIDERTRINNKREGKDGNDGKFIFLFTDAIYYRAGFPSRDTRFLS